MTHGPERLAGRFEIVERLGAGRFGTTWLVLDETGRELVLKRISTRRVMSTLQADVESMSGPSWQKVLELCKREAEVLRQLDHPGVPNYEDFFVIESEHDVELCLVQERVAGETLAERLEAGTRFTEAEVWRLAERCAAILAYLHGLSPPVIHRDLKPSNIMLTDDGRVYLVDFGAVMDALDEDTGGSTIIGTFGYMPLEQYEGRAVPASDVYALGVTLIELLSRKPPRELERIKLALDYHPHVRISDRFRAVLDRMIALDPAARPRDGAALLRLLEQPDTVPLGAVPPLPPYAWDRGPTVNRFTNDSQPVEVLADVPANVRCPQCHRRPSRDETWNCDLCGARFNTFLSGGVCPVCHHHHATTACSRLRCVGRTPHAAWYATDEELAEHRARTARRALLRREHVVVTLAVYLTGALAFGTWSAVSGWWVGLAIAAVFIFSCTGVALLLAWAAGRAAASREAGHGIEAERHPSATDASAQRNAGPMRSMRSVHSPPE